jgi:anti-sigma factor RsiW
MVEPDRQRFSELLPFYVNGTLDSADRIWMEDYQAQHPETHAEVQFTLALQSVARNVRSPVPEAESLRRLLAAWHDERQTTRSWLSRLGQMLILPLRVPVAALATGVVLFVAQSVVLVQQGASLDEANLYRSGRPECQAVAPRLRVVFAPEAKHLEVVLLLRKLEMTVQQGPSESGEFWLSVPAGRSPEEALAMLRTTPMVEEAMIVSASRLPAGCDK